MLCKLGKCKSILLPKQFFTFIFYLVHTEKYIRLYYLARILEKRVMKQKISKNVVFRKYQRQGTKFRMLNYFGITQNNLIAYY